MHLDALDDEAVMQALKKLELKKATPEQLSELKRLAPLKPTDMTDPNRPISGTL